MLNLFTNITFLYFALDRHHVFFRVLVVDEAQVLFVLWAEGIQDYDKLVMLTNHEFVGRIVLCGLSAWGMWKARSAREQYSFQL